MHQQLHNTHTNNTIQYETTMNIQPCKQNTNEHMQNTTIQNMKTELHTHIPTTMQSPNKCMNTNCNSMIFNKEITQQLYKQHLIRLQTITTDDLATNTT